MLSLSLPEKDAYRILCLGAHCDDIEIGCGGTILKLLERYGSRVHMTWVVFSSTRERAAETRQSARQFSADSGGFDLTIHRYKDGFLPASWGEVKKDFEALKKSVAPDVIFTPCREDLHQDHRIVSELTWNTFRDHLVLEYEIPKYDGDLGHPGVFMPLEPALCEKKTRIILESYASQRVKTWLTQDTLMGLLRIRGVECASPTGLAEAFHGRKLLL